jgi:hypothetical protein
LSSGRLTNEAALYEARATDRVVRAGFPARYCAFCDDKRNHRFTPLRIPTTDHFPFCRSSARQQRLADPARTSARPAAADPIPAAHHPPFCCNTTTAPNAGAARTVRTSCRPRDNLPLRPVSGEIFASAQ